MNEDTAALRRALIAEEEARTLRKELESVSSLHRDFEHFKTLYEQSKADADDLQNEVKELTQRVKKAEKVLDRAEWYGRGVIYAGGAALLLISQFGKFTAWLKTL